MDLNNLLSNNLKKKKKKKKKKEKRRRRSQKHLQACPQESEKKKIFFFFLRSLVIGLLARTPQIHGFVDQGWDVTPIKNVKKVSWNHLFDKTFHGFK